MISPKRKETTAKYRKFVENIEEPKNTFKEVYSGMALGSNAFIKGILARLEDDLSERRDISNRRELRSPLKTEWIIDCVSSHYKIGKDRIFEGGLNQNKKIVIYLVKRHTGAPNPEIGELFNISYSGVAKVYQRYYIRWRKTND